MVDVNGAKGCRYRFVGKPKMISFGVYGEVSLTEARRKREGARALLAKRFNLSDTRKADKIALSFLHDNSFEAAARELHASKKSIWSNEYAKEVSGYLERDIFPYVGHRPIEQIEPLELLAVLKKIDKRGALEQASKIRRRCGEVLRFAVVTDRAKYNFAPDLAIALNKPKQNHFPFLTEK